MKITLENARLAIRFPYNPIDVARIRNMPDRRWNAKRKCWTANAVLVNMQYLDETFPEAEWSVAAHEKREHVYVKAEGRAKTLVDKQGDIDCSVLDNVPFGKPPMDHQKKALLLALFLKDYAPADW